MKRSGNKNMILRCFSYPLSAFFGLAVGIRNLLFDWNVLKQHSFSFPVLSVGNITVGGTGKTPMTEYLACLLKDKYTLGILSRGYGRQSSGFLLAQSGSGPALLGDELYQIHSKFPEIFVAACSDRVKGMKALDIAAGGLDIALLDDAYQHRYIVRDVNILLIDYNRPISEDRLLPLGLLREPEREKNRADVIVVTKCPGNISPMSQRLFEKYISPRSYQSLFFTSLAYGKPKPVFPDSDLSVFDGDHTALGVVLLSGVASPEPFENYLNTVFQKTASLRYPDHFAYRGKDIVEIEKRLSKLDASVKIVMTTEKDAVKLREMQSQVSDSRYWFYVPVEIVFINDSDKERFDQKILSYVRKNQRNNLLHQRRASGVSS